MINLNVSMCVFFIFLLISVDSCVAQDIQIKDPFKKNRAEEEKRKDGDRLDNYSLAELTIKGVIDGKKEKWLIVSDPLHRIYHIKSGETLGRELAVVLKITMDDIFLKMPTTDEKLLSHIAAKAEMVQVKNHEQIFVLPVVHDASTSKKDNNET